MDEWGFLRDCGSDVRRALESAPLDDRNFAGWADDALRERSLSRGAVVGRSGLNHTYAYQILSGSRNPTRDKLLQVCFGMGLGVEDASDALERGGLSALRPDRRRDVVIAFCLERGMGVTRCDHLLWEQGERPLTGGAAPGGPLANS